MDSLENDSEDRIAPQNIFCPQPHLYLNLPKTKKALEKASKCENKILDKRVKLIKKIIINKQKEKIKKVKQNKKKTLKHVKNTERYIKRGILDKEYLQKKLGGKIEIIWPKKN